eukprot:582622-Rhodomonas_salina.1
MTPLNAITTLLVMTTLDVMRTQSTTFRANLSQTQAGRRKLRQTQTRTATLSATATSRRTTSESQRRLTDHHTPSHLRQDGHGRVSRRRHGPGTTCLVPRAWDYRVSLWVAVFDFGAQAFLGR